MHQPHILIKYVRLITLFVFLCSLVGFLQPLFPLTDLFNHFRIQAVVGLAICLFTLIYLNDRKGILFCTLMLLMNISIVGYKLHLTGGIPSLPDGTAETFSIVTSNVLTSNTDYVAVLSMIEKENPDFILLVEVNDSWVKNLEPLEEKYKYSFKYPSEDNFGIAAYSKIPFEGSVKNSGGEGLPILVAKLQNGTTVLGVHPLPPASEWSVFEQNLYFKDVVKLASVSNSPVVVTGDFNTTLWSVAIDPLIEGGLKRINPLGLAYTWPTSDTLFGIQIDHFFGKNIEAADFKTLPSIGSDHYPIRADILVKSAAAE